METSAQSSRSSKKHPRASHAPPVGPALCLTAAGLCVLNMQLRGQWEGRRGNEDAAWFHSDQEVFCHHHASVPGLRASLGFGRNLKITGLEDQVTYYLGNTVSNLNSILALEGSNPGYSERRNLAVQQTPDV